MNRAIVALVVLAACADVGPPRIEGPLHLGGAVIAADTLRRGRAGYVRYCQPCHGPKGDGQGPLGLQQRPQARDLRLGIIKFASVPTGQLPTDDDLRRIVRNGLAGTAMLPWRVSDADLDPIVQYIKVFAERWQRELPGDAVATTPDPWPEPTAALERGREAYHALGCARCHPAQLAEPALREVAAARGLAADALLRTDPHRPAVTESSFGSLKATDFRRDPLRNGSSTADLYRVIAAGVGGTAMPTWKGAIAEEELWALVHYVRSLAPGNGSL